MTDDVARDFENDVREMLSGRVAGMPAAYDASSELVRRVRRRRGARLATVAATVVVVVAGATGGVAQVLSQQNTHRLAVSDGLEHENTGMSGTVRLATTSR